MKRFFTLLALLTGCTGSFSQTRPEAPTRCNLLDDRQATWGALGKGGVVLSSAGGIATLPVSEDDKTLRLGLAATSLGFAAFSVMSLYLADSAANSWARDCSAK